MSGYHGQKRWLSALGAKALIGIRRKAMESEDDKKILEDLKTWIEANKPIIVKIKVPLKTLFPESKKKHLERFRTNNSHADLAIFRHHELVCIVEPGGKAHFSDPKQRTRDKKKLALCLENNIEFLSLANGSIDLSGGPRTQKLKDKLKKKIYGAASSGLTP